MAIRETIEFTDDVDGTPADETVLFELDGVRYAVDLSSANAAKLRDGLRLFMAAARKTSNQMPRTAHRQYSPHYKTRGRGRLIRNWAAEQGIKIKSRGRIHESIVERYVAAHPGD